MTEKIITIEQLRYNIQRSIAVTHYHRFNDKSRLLALGLDPKQFKHRGGRPRKVHFTGEDIVELVYKQHFQEGKPFSNSDGSDNNQCFYGVADNQGRNVSEVRRDFYSVPQQRREIIKNWIKEELRKAGQLKRRR